MIFLEIKCTNKWCAKSGRCWRFNAPDNGKNLCRYTYKCKLCAKKY